MKSSGSEAQLRAFYAENPTPRDGMRIPLANFISDPEESLVKAQRYLEEEGVVFITYALDEEFTHALEQQLVTCIRKMDPEKNGELKHMKNVVRQNPLKGVWSTPRGGSFVLAQQMDDPKLDRLPLDITGNGDNDLGISMAYNPIYTHVTLWALEHRKDLAAILFKLTYPRGVVDRDTCTWVNKQSRGKFDMTKPSYDVVDCDRYRSMLVYDNGRRLMFLPKSHSAEFPQGRVEKKRKRTVIPFMSGSLYTKDVAQFGVSAPATSESNNTGTLVIFKDVVYFEYGQLRGKDSHVFRINTGVHDVSRMTEKDRLSLAMVAAARDFTPTITGNNVTMSTVARGAKFAPYAPIFDGKRQAKYRKRDEKQSATFRQCKNMLNLQRDTMYKEFQKIKPLTRHMMGDTQDDPFSEASPEVQAIWKAAL